MWENAAEMQIVSSNWCNMLEGCGVMPTVHSPLIHIWRQNLRSIWHIETIHYILEHDIALLTPTLVARVPASSGQKSPDTSRHALHQGPHPSWPNCSPRLADSIV